MSQLRIGLELFGTQTASRGRGIGRYVRNLAIALLSLADRSSAELIFMLRTAHPPTCRQISPSSGSVPSQPWAIRRAADSGQPRRLDGLIFLNPLELTPGFDIPAADARPQAGRGHL